MQRDLLVLDQMIAAAERATAISNQHGVSALADRPDPRDALLWNMSVLGEAAGQLSTELRGSHPELPWRQAIALRNRIVHGYWSVDLQVIHTTAKRDLPAFREQLALLRDEVSTSPDASGPDR